MKCVSNYSEDNSMTAEPCLCKVRFLTLVITTADLINEATTETFGIFHAICTPAAIMTTYFFLSSLLLGTCLNRQASSFLQMYALITCSMLHLFLCVSVFQELRAYPAGNDHAVLVMNGVLPLLIVCLLISDLVVTMFMCRRGQTLELPDSQPSRSQSGSAIPVHIM